MHSIKSLVIALLLAGTAWLLIFGPRQGRSLPADRVIVDYWEKWSGAEEAQMRRIVDEFNRTDGAQKHIFVRYSSMATVYQRTLVATAAGVPPDIAGLFDFNLVQFAAMNALSPLEDLAREHHIDESYYKPVYWKALNYNGHLYALISTPAAVGLHYSKRAFAESAQSLRAAGLDPSRPPRTIDELDRYAKALTTFDARGRITRAGFLPMEPNWFVNYLGFWFDAPYWDPATHKLLLTDPAMVRTYQWIESYSRWLGTERLNDFQSGFGNFNSPQNAFLAGEVAMELQGPWMANFIYSLKPSLSTVRWPKDVEMTKSPAQRPDNYEWAVAPFPSAVPGMDDVTYCGFDTLTIPAGARHKREAFEFIAYINRQDVMEKLCSLHCKSSPLANVSESFIRNHPNPYVSVFERLTRGPNARTVPQIPIMPEVLAELTNLSQQVSLLQVDPAEALERIQTKLQAEYDEFAREQRARHATAF
jgi:ABC-type glycerol-3-phosphate transport system substrate-binding protein